MHKAAEWPPETDDGRLCFCCYWLNWFLVISEMIALLSSLRKEGLLMPRKILNEVMAYAKSTKGCVITSWDAHLPYRESLLKSLCNPSEKGI
jgi:hypothetical protein